jgi:hypothetical protein
MPTEPSNFNGSLFSRASGDVVRDRLSGPGGLRPVNEPLASVTVLMPPSSCVLLSILAAASELEKRAGSWGRAVREEKKRGEGGWPSRLNWARLGKLK